MKAHIVLQLLYLTSSGSLPRPKALRGSRSHSSLTQLFQLQTPDHTVSPLQMEYASSKLPLSPGLQSKTSLSH